MAIVEPDHYMDGDTMISWMADLSEKYQRHVLTQTIGRTWEGRPLNKLMIDFTDLEAGETPRSVVITSGLHAREWLAHASVLWVVFQLIVSNSSEAVTLRENFVWHIFPNMNPDGYYTTFNEDRRWRKNKRPYHHNELCFGVDLNRNWNWNFGDHSNDPCSSIYEGPHAFSEQETVSLKEQLLSMRDEIIFVLDVHAHAQMILHPDDANDHVIFVAKKISEAMTSVSGNKFVSGTSQDLLNYPPNGTFFHWAHSVIGIEHSYAIEVQPRLTDWFIGDLAPDGLITKSGQELLVGIYAALESILAKI